MISSDLVSQSALVVGKNLLQKIKEIDDRYEPSPEWERDILSALRFCIEAEKGITTAKAAVLAIIEQRWDELSLAFRMEYNNQFNVLVYRETGILPSTMDNYIRAAETFIVRGKKPFGQVEIPERDSFGKVVLESGAPRTMFVDFDPMQVSLSKLSLMRSAVEKGDMSPKRWSMLADKGVTVEELKQELYRISEPARPAGMKFVIDGNSLVVTEPGYEPLEIGEIFYEMWEHDLGKRAIKSIMARLGIPYDEDVIAQHYERQKNRILNRIYEDMNEPAETK